MDIGDESGSQGSVGGALGVKMPLAERLGWRLELGYARRFDDEPLFAAANIIFGSVGFSFFTR